MGIGNNCHIENAIIDKNVRIGNRVTIIGHEDLDDEETDTYCIKKGIIVVKKNAYIKADTVIGKPRA